MKNISGKKIICKKCEIRIDKKNMEKSSDDIIDFVHTSGIFPNVNEDYCPKDKTPLYPACPNCIFELGTKLQKEERLKTIEWVKEEFYKLYHKKIRNQHEYLLMVEIMKILEGGKK
jgi:hypothetical protein